MITPMEVKKVSDLAKQYLEAERHIDAALRRGASTATFSTRLYWLCKLDLHELAGRYREAGWATQVVPDSRDGDYLEIGYP